MEEEIFNKTVKLQYSFSGFLWREIAEIKDFQDMNQHYEALKRTLDLINYLPKDVQNKFQPEAKKMRDAIKKIRENSTGVDAFTHLVDTADSLDAFAEEKLNRFLSKLILFLDKKDYLEIGSIKPKHKIKRLEVPK